MTTTTEASTDPEVIVTWDGLVVRIIAVPSNNAGARLLLPFVERAQQAWPDEDRAASLMREGLSFLAGFCRGGNVRPDEEPGMLAAARNYLASAA